MRVRRGFLGKGLAECLVIARQPRIFRRTLKKSVAQPRVVGFASRLLAEGPRVAPTPIEQQEGLPLAVALMGDFCPHTERSTTFKQVRPAKPFTSGLGPKEEVIDWDISLGAQDLLNLCLYVAHDIIQQVL